jgi:ubiquinol-cytochrome c reductase cytochrome c subunit
MSERRRHRLLLAAPLLVTLVATPVVVRASAGQGGGGDELALGRELYETGCASCHGAEGQGVVGAGSGVSGPSLADAGEAAAYYYLSTGRMPLNSSDDQPTRKKPVYDRRQIDALVAYAGTLGKGPAVPNVDIAAGNLARGGEIYRANCQACHSASGSGGALSYGHAAPRLAAATPTEIGAAVRVGPGEMPAFGDDIISNRDLNSLARYVRYLHDPADPGGLPIGRTGPIPEGFVAWLVGMVALLALVMWIGTRSPIRRRRREQGT